MMQNTSMMGDALWAEGARWLPSPSPEEQRAGLVLLQELAKGEPLASADFARALGEPLEAAETFIRQSALRPFVHVAEGRILGFWLSVRRTPHQFTINGRTLWTWCALDALFVPELLGATARIESRDPETDELISLTVSPDSVEAASSNHIVMSMNRPNTWDAASAARLMESACHFIFFFASLASAERWQAKHADTVLLPLDEAFAYGKRYNAQLFGVELARRAG